MSGDTLDQLKRALVTLKELRGRLDAVERSRSEPIAVIGMGCRFPGGVNSPEAFWELLENGVDAITETPRDRWDVDALYDPDPTTAGKIATRWGGFVDPVDQFDPYFFGISPREANRMDPQQRLLLEVAWQALEHAGQTREGLKGSLTGVFVGVHSHSSDYYLMQAGNVEAMDTYTGTGTSHSVVSGRLSYLFDWQGPNIALDTACSSSLVATHLAVQSLRNKESNMALVGGVNIMLSPHFSIAASRMHMLSADGRCKAFDAAADGFVRGEGCGVVVLKRLSDALADGDPILALIRGTAINQDGNTNGLTAPNSLSQEAVIRAALANAGVSPEQIGYVETHGTGTSLGDPIEIEALTAVLGANNRPCYLGSAKTNIGHLEGAAGVTGLIKAVLTLQHQAVPPVVHFTQLNPHISLDNTPFQIPTALTPWEEESRYAGLSSFGWSGTNAHIVLEQAPPQKVESQSQDGAVVLLPLSARAPEALLTTASLYRDFLAETDTPLHDIGYTASQRRSHHDHRLVVVGHSREELIGQLETFLRGEMRPGIATGTTLETGLTFVFPGQGGQWLGMGRQLLEREPAFREAITRCEAAFKPFVDWSLLEQLTADESQSRLDEIDVVQPMLFAVQAALAALWRSWGIEPQAVVGHSLGEVAAAHVAGILSLDDAARVICRRSQLMKRVSGRGAMAVTELSLEDARAAIHGYEDRLSIAVSNSPRSTVLSGDPAALEEVMRNLKQQGIFCRHVKVDVAAHSPHMDALRPELVKELAGIRPQAGSVPMISTVTGEIQDGHTFDAAYWGQNLRQPVLFATAMQKLVEEGFNTFVEIGPHPVLLPAIEGAWQSNDLRLFASMRREEDEQMVMWGALGGLHCAGYPVDWRKWYPTGRHVNLPMYPWQHERFWLDFETPGIGFGAARGMQETASNPLLGWRVHLADAPDRFVWENTLDNKKFPYLYDHRIQGVAVLPASAYLELVLAAARENYGDRAFRLLDVHFQRALFLAEDSAATVQVTLSPSPEGMAFGVYSRAQGSTWTLHVTGHVHPEAEATFTDWDSIETLRQGTPLEASDFYQSLEENGIGLYDSLRRILSIWNVGDAALAEVQGKKTSLSLDSGFQLSSAIAPESDAIFMPASVGDVRVVAPLQTQMWVYAHLRSQDDNNLIQDIVVLDGNGRVLAEIESLRLQRLGGASLDRTEDWLYEIQWQVKPPAEQKSATTSGLWLIFADQRGVGAALGEQLAAAGETYKLVYAADGDNTQEQVAASIADADNSVRVAHIVFLWSLDIPNIESVATLELAETLGVGGVLRVAQAFNGVDDPPRIWLATQGAQAVDDSMPVATGQSPLWGLGRVMAEEQPELWGGLIDLPGEVAPEVLANIIVSNILCFDGEDQAAYRHGERFVPRLVRQQPTEPQTLSFRPDASYLITGGMGGIGLRLAHRMVEQGARRLILMGRTPLPTRAEWGNVDPNSTAGQRIAAIRKLETLGASVHLAFVDVADENQLSAYLDHYRREGWPPIRGVMHTAAVIDDRLMIQLDEQALHEVMKPKVVGGWLLHQLLDDLDFFVLFSSVGSVLGQAGQGNYAAANAFLDALAYNRRQQGLPGLSINWGAWTELGFAATAGGARTIQHLEQQGIYGFTSDQGVAALDYLLQRQAGNAPQVVVMPVDWAKLRQARSVHPPLLAELIAASDGASLPAAPKTTGGIRGELLAAEPKARLPLIEAYLQRQIAQVLKLDPSRIEPLKPLGSLGVDSLMALELRNRLEADLGVAFSATLVWNYPTVADMAKHVAGKIGVALEEVSVAAKPESQSTKTSQPLDNVLNELEELSDEEALNRLLGQ